MHAQQTHIQTDFFVLKQQRETCFDVILNVKIFFLKQTKVKYILQMRKDSYAIYI